MANHLKCKFCDYTIPFNYRFKNGKFCSAEKAYARLRDHCEEKHSDIFTKVIDKLDTEYGESYGDEFLR